MTHPVLPRVEETESYTSAVINNNDLNIMNDINELEDIRKQISELKLRLERETTLNERLLHDSLKGKMRSVHNIVWRMIVIGILGIVVWCFAGHLWNLSPYFLAITIFMFLASMSAEYLINRMDERDFSANLSEAVARLVKMKRMRLIQVLVGFAFLLVVWGPWMVCEMFPKFEPEMRIPMAIGMSIGAIAGAIRGLTFFFKMQRANDEMIRQIEEFTK